MQWRTVITLDADVLQGQFSYAPRGPDTVFAECDREVANRVRMPADLQQVGALLLTGTDVHNT